MAEDDKLSTLDATMLRRAFALARAPRREAGSRSIQPALACSLSSATLRLTRPGCTSRLASCASSGSR